jgi:hypothetical protein
MRGKRRDLNRRGAKVAEGTQREEGEMNFGWRHHTLVVQVNEGEKAG